MRVSSVCSPTEQPSIPRQDNTPTHFNKYASNNFLDHQQAPDFDSGRIMVHLYMFCK